MKIIFKTQSGRKAIIEIDFGAGRAASKVHFQGRENMEDIREAKALSDLIVGFYMSDVKSLPDETGSKAEVDKVVRDFLGPKQ